ncbi:hypothetical protein BH10PSE7_BH10PSE7_44150 [soil metagenome]
MYSIRSITKSVLAAVCGLYLTGSLALAGGLFGEGGLIRGSVGNALDKAIEKPITTPLAQGGEKTIKEIGKTLEATGKGALAISGLKTLEDTLIQGKSLNKSLKESLRDIKTGVKSAADVRTLPNSMESALAEVTRNTLGKEAGRALGIILLPEQIARSFDGAVVDALLSTSEKADNVENIVGIPLSAALKQAKQYYSDKGSPLPVNRPGFSGGRFI